MSGTIFTIRKVTNKGVHQETGELFFDGRCEDMLDEILTKLKNRNEVTDEELEYLLSAESEEDKEKIYEAARDVRDKNFGSKVFLYGFVYFSTICRNNCTFCYFRRDNNNPPRYRKSLDEIVHTAKELANSGVHLIDLTTGEDPMYVNNPKKFADIVRAVKNATGLPVMTSPGVFSKEGIKELKDAGASWYALYQETHNTDLFKQLRIEQSYEERIAAKEFASSIGLLVEEGLLTGVGDSIKDRVRSFRNMRNLNASQVRAMAFVNQDGAPLVGEKLNGCDRELLAIAVMRLLFPDTLIPASLDVEGIKGLKNRLNAGANVVTSIIPPKEGYAGVANSVKDVDEGYRTVAGIQDTLRECGLCNASPREYMDWIEKKTQKILVA